MKPKHPETIETMKRLAHWVKLFRKFKSVKKTTQSDLAKTARYSRVTLSNIERASPKTGTDNPHIDLLIGIGKAMGISFADLMALCECDQEKPPSHEVLERVAKAWGLTAKFLSEMIPMATDKEPGAGYSSPWGTEEIARHLKEDPLVKSRALKAISELLSDPHLTPDERQKIERLLLGFIAIVKDGITWKTTS